MSPLWIIFGLFMIVSLIVGNILKSKFKKYSKLPVNYNLSGREVAEKMLAEHGIYDVRVVSVTGSLTDHYHPVKKTVNLSPEVYNGRNISAAAVAAHECGHAVQHATGYSWLDLRTTLVPVQNISAKIINVMFIAMFLGVFAIKGLLSFNTAMMVIIACYAILTLFAFITLPVEVNASKRALAWLNKSGITQNSHHRQAEDALNWAGYTYVVAALSSLASLIYFVLMFAGGDD